MFIRQVSSSIEAGWRRPGRAGVLSAAVLAAALLVPSLSRAATGELPASILHTKTLTFCTSLSQPPLEFVDAMQHPIGAEIEFGEALAKRLDLKAKWINIPFSGLIPALQAGQCNAIMSQLFIKPPRLKVIDEVPYSWSQEILTFKKGSKVVDEPIDMSGKKVASVTGTTATVLLEQANAKLKAEGKPLIKIVDFPTGTAAFQQLVLGQVDAYGASFEIGQYYNKHNPGEIVTGSKPFYKILTGIGVRKDEPGLSAALEKNIAAMMKDGSYAAIYAKWDLKNDMLSAPMPTQPESK